MFYKIHSETLNQECILKEKNNSYEMDCADGTHYTKKEMFLIGMKALIDKNEDKKLNFPKGVHDIKKIFEGEIVEIVEANETIKTTKRRQKCRTLK